MISTLKLFNAPSGVKLKSTGNGEVFTITTCQRTMVLGFGQFPLQFIKKDDLNKFEAYCAEEAYQFLLETICGLKSKIIGENEVVSQFKEAFQSFLDKANKAQLLIYILEKLFKDAKEIRTKYLLNINSDSYAGMTRKIIRDRFKTKENLLILGSGKLAEDCLKILLKKYNVILSARNSHKLIHFQQNYNIDVASWCDFSHYANIPIIINTIGVEQKIFKHNFFLNWNETQFDQKIFIDLGHPSSIDTQFNKSDDVFRLDDIFEIAKDFSQIKEYKITLAKEAIEKIVEKRITNYTLSIPFSWEELQFV